jgi:hypothetical protein
MDAYEVCGACACHIKSHELACPFCGAPHVRGPGRARRLLTRGSRAQWLAFGSTLALTGCSDGSSSTPSAQLADGAALVTACTVKAGTFSCTLADGGAVLSRRLHFPARQPRWLFFLWRPGEPPPFPRPVRPTPRVRVHRGVPLDKLCRVQFLLQRSRRSRSHRPQLSCLLWLAPGPAGAPSARRWLARLASDASLILNGVRWERKSGSLRSGDSSPDGWRALRR